MMGTWKDFPAFAGVCAVWLRRNSPTFENNLSPYFIHCNKHGSFTEKDKATLKTWVQEILRPDPNSKTFFEECLSYLILYEALGGNVSSILKENISASSHNHTPLYQAILDTCEQSESALNIDEDWIRNFYLSKDSEWRYGDQTEYIQEIWVEKIIAALKQTEDSLKPFA